MGGNETTAVMKITILMLASLLSIGLPAQIQANSDSSNVIKPKAIGHPDLLSPHSSPLALHDKHLFVVNTPADTVDVIDTNAQITVRRIPVGIDPVSIAVRPDGQEIWVANHVSDSVSVIDSNLNSLTYLQVIATIQEFDQKTKSTRFDEPVGIAFANNDKAYVALSSENKIAVVDVANRKIAKRLHIPAQDPRAILVRRGQLYVLPFESNNKTQLSGGRGDRIDGDLVTFDAYNHSLENNNVLSLGHVIDIVKHPNVPDKDLFIFDTETDELIDTVDTLGTLLYGLTVDSNGRVYIAQTDARNDINGRAGTKKHGLEQLENRAFLNRITQVSFGNTDFIDLEPLPPVHPEPGQGLATPFGITISPDNHTLFITAAGSDMFVSLDVATGEILDRVAVDAVPRGIALDSYRSQAWVFNAVANSVSLIDIADRKDLEVVRTISLVDPTHPIFKQGRIAFNNARASTTESFSCASCHPDGHTDQLLWVLKTPIVTGGDQIMPRSTMPLRGLRDTAPFHWDGIPGDPYGGNNSAHTRSDIEPNSKLDEPASTTRHVIDGSLSSTMAMVGDENKNDKGQAGRLAASERDALAKFLLHLTYPPAQRRAYNNQLSKQAENGFKMFHIVGDVGGTPGGNLCGNCHRMPFWVSTNTPGTGMDAPTWRGAYDRFLILPQGRLNIIDFDFYRRVAEAGNDERSVWQFSWGGRSAFNSVWDMVLEGSTGYSGSFARQITLNHKTAEAPLTMDLLEALENSATDGGVVLQADGVIINHQQAIPISLQFQGHRYVTHDGEWSFSRKELQWLAMEHQLVATFTGRHGARTNLNFPQPALWTLGSIQEQRGKQEFPVLFDVMKTMRVSARHLHENAHIVIDGRKAMGEIQDEDGETIAIALDKLPSPGMHFLQVQNPDGLYSNDFIFHVAEDEEQARQLRYEHNPDLLRNALGTAIESGNLEETKRFLNAGAPINARRSSNGMTPLSTAAFHGHSDIVHHLILDRKAHVSYHNRDGNTPLHLATFLCRTEIVQFLLKHGAAINKRSDRGERAVDTVSSDWNDGLARFYISISEGAGFQLDLDEMKQGRPQMMKLLQDYAGEPDHVLTVLARGAEGWCYQDSGEALSSLWNGENFHDDAWRTGQAPLGYGENDIATTLSFGDDPRRKHPAAFFRHTFEIEDVNASEVFACALRADDGAVVYVNGKEVQRVRMANGLIGHTSFAAGGTQSESGLEGRMIPFKIDRTALKNGNNVIAVSVHQRHGSSSDLVMDLEILGVSEKDFVRLRRNRNH